ncbi:MAG: hypothetical protein JXR91_07545 [Deltaproteobacteria bacterium]|nr:hypothetical protein [Deltaproteobacteria bacterium]
MKITILYLVLLIALSGCGDGSGAGDKTGDTDPSFGIDTAPPVEVQCPDSPPPVELSDSAIVVGDGSGASCDEAALRKAADKVNSDGGGEISFDCGGPHTIVLEQAIYLNSGSDGEIVIDGGGDITLSGGKSTRILDLENHTNLTIQSISLEDGFVVDNEAEEENTPSNSGAAIRHPWYGTLVAIDVLFKNNHCASRDGEIGGGAVYAGGLSKAIFSGCTFKNNSASNGGGILNRGSTLTVLNSVFAGNGALSVGDGQFGNGGGLYIDGMNYDTSGDFIMCGTRFVQNTAMTHGSGVFAYFYEGSQSTITDCEFNGNSFGDPASGSGALYHESVPLLLRGTTFANQTTGAHAGAIFVGQNTVATIENCTFADNSVTTNGGAIFNGAATANFTNCTFTGNSADYGPAIFKGKEAAIGLKNCIFSYNTTQNEYSATSCHESFTDNGGNIQWPEIKNNGNPDTPCTEGIVFADPLLQTLGDNGGFSLTAAIAKDSPAIDLGSDCPKVDQRGEPRSASCDAGAFELQ